MNVGTADENLLLLLSSLLYALEESAIRVKAYEQVIAAHAPNLAIKARETEAALRGSAVQKRYGALRERVIRAVQENKLSELAGMVGEVSSLTRSRM